MSSKRIPAPEDVQPQQFSFNEPNLIKAKEIISRYPEGREASAIMPLLDLAQRQHQGWLPLAAINYVADMIGAQRIRAYEVATFYTMYNLAPVGKNVLQVCTTTPCRLRGADDVLSLCKKRLGINAGETTTDGQFTLLEVECLGACVNSPVIWIGDDYYEDLSNDIVEKILDELIAGELISKPGSQIGRSSSEPKSNRKTLMNEG